MAVSLNKRVMANKFWRSEENEFIQSKSKRVSKIGSEELKERKFKWRICIWVVRKREEEMDGNEGSLLILEEFYLVGVLAFGLSRLYHSHRYSRFPILNLDITLLLYEIIMVLY